MLFSIVSWSISSEIEREMKMLRGPQGSVGSKCNPVQVTAWFGTRFAGSGILVGCNADGQNIITTLSAAALCEVVSFAGVLHLF